MNPKLEVLLGMRKPQVPKVTRAKTSKKVVKTKKVEVKAK